MALYTVTDSFGIFSCHWSLNLLIERQLSTMIGLIVATVPRGPPFATEDLAIGDLTAAKYLKPVATEVS